MTNEQSKEKNEQFPIFLKLENLDYLENYPEFKELLYVALTYSLSNVLGFEMFTVIVQEHVEQTGDDDLFFALQDFREQLHDYLTNKEKQK